MIQHHIYSFLPTTDGSMAHSFAYMCLANDMYELNLLIWMKRGEVLMVLPDKQAGG